MNTLKSTLLLVALTVFLVLMGDRLGGRSGMLTALLISVGFNFFSYFYSDKLALRMYRAQIARREDLPRAFAALERLTAKVGLPMPAVYVLPTESPNAFATGRDPAHASVAVTHGILRLLDDEELEGVLAHELGHVKNRDILTASIAATLAGAITLIARMGYFASIFGGGGGRRERGGGGMEALLMIVLAPVAAMMIQMAVSRSREFEADATAARTTGNPYALARALQKLESYSKRVPMNASPSTAHMFIVAPLLGGGGFGSLFSTHPPIAERVRQLIGHEFV